MTDDISDAMRQRIYDLIQVNWVYCKIHKQHIDDDPLTHLIVEHGDIFELTDGAGDTIDILELEKDE